ncbi:regulator of G-protein signaling 14-like isoform X1 [Arapaima gigas]
MYIAQLSSSFTTDTSVCPETWQPGPKTPDKYRQKVILDLVQELNMAQQQVRGHSRSLNCGTSSPQGQNVLGTVASWAISFEKLLEDPTGVLCFTAFLKSEVSAENILFWQACEKFRKIPASQKEKLSREAHSIYETYLSNNATHAVNIDKKARVQESDLESPSPDMFHQAQQQIFKLMKFDSYTRFVRSQLYRNCVLADMEGRPFPEAGQMPKSPERGRSGLADSHSPADKRNKKSRPAKSRPFDAEDSVERRKGTAETRACDKRREKRGSWGAELHDHYAFLHTESQGSVRSSTAKERVSLQGQSELERSSTCSQQQAASGGSAAGEGYCCVFFPDGTASLAMTRPGVSVRDMLTDLCRKRGVPLHDVIIYLRGKDKRHVSLDQDSSVLKEQQVILEFQVAFLLEIAFTGKITGIVVKSSKSLEEALSPVLEKHSLKPRDVVVTISGEREQLNMSMEVSSLANKQLHLDQVKGKRTAHNSRPNVSSLAPIPERQPAGPRDTMVAAPLPSDRVRPHGRRRNPGVRRTYDMDGLMDLLTRAQFCSADDQRGLLCKEHLEMPPFLQLPLLECTEEAQDEMPEKETHRRASKPLPYSEPETDITDTRLSSYEPDSCFLCTDSTRETIV